MLRVASLSTRFRLAAALVRGTIGAYLRITLEGAEHLPKQAPCILAANHRSWLDPPMVCAYLLPKVDCMISPAATAELFTGPIGLVLRSMDAYVIDRDGGSNLKSLRGMLRKLKRQHPILIFPEGGIPDPPDHWTVKPGVGFLARKANVPVIPIALLGTDEALPVGSHIPKPKRVHIRVGPPLDLSGDGDDLQRAHHIMDAIRQLHSDLERDFRPTSSQ